MTEELEIKMKEVLISIEKYLNRKRLPYNEKYVLDVINLHRISEIYRNNFRKVEEMLPKESVNSPIWRLLIEIYVAEVQGRLASIGDASRLANIPVTTGLRYLTIMEEKNLIYRKNDPLDKRRSWLCVTPQGSSIIEYTMKDLLKSAEEIFNEKFNIYQQN